MRYINKMGRGFINIHTLTPSEVEEKLRANNIKFNIEDKQDKEYDRYKKYSMMPYEDLTDFNKDYFQFKCGLEDDTDDILLHTIQRLFGAKENGQHYLYHNYKKPKAIKKFVCREKHIPTYPIYVVSKDRYQDKRHLTVSWLEKVHLPYTLCVLESEESQYRKMMETNEYTYGRIITYDGDGTEGSTPQRNTCWEDAKEKGFEKHWMLDDNINGYYRFHKLCQMPLDDGVVFKALEDLADNIKEPIGLIGHEYKSTIPDCEMRQPLVFNTKVYSSILINHALLDEYNIKWRLKYNEDVDLTLCCLTNKIRTISSTQILSGKQSTGSMKGGNQDIYENHTEGGFSKKVNCLVDAHPSLVENDVIKVSTKLYKDRRSHHKVNYKKIGCPTTFTPKVSLHNWKDYGIDTVYNKGYDK